jgi:hypothetical protein
MGHSSHKQNFMDETTILTGRLQHETGPWDSLQKIKRFGEQHRLINDRKPFISAWGCET